MKTLFTVTFAALTLFSSSAMAICFNVDDRPVAQVGGMPLREAANRVCLTSPMNMDHSRHYEVGFARGMGQFVRFVSEVQYKDHCDGANGVCRTYRISSAISNGRTYPASVVITFHVVNGEGVISVGHDLYKIKQGPLN